MGQPANDADRALATADSGGGQSMPGWPGPAPAAGGPAPAAVLAPGPMGVEQVLAAASVGAGEDTARQELALGRSRTSRRFSGPGPPRAGMNGPWSLSSEGGPRLGCVSDSKSLPVPISR